MSHKSDVEIVLRVATDEWMLGHYDCFKRTLAVHALERMQARATLKHEEKVLTRPRRHGRISA